MAILAVSATRQLMTQLPSQAPVSVSILGSTAAEGTDGTWTVTVHAAEDQIPALEALGYAVEVVTTDAQLLGQWQEIAVDPPPPEVEVEV
jgi:hypothetical protein